VNEFSPQSQEPLPQWLPQSLQHGSSPQLQAPSPHTVPQSLQQVVEFSPPWQQPSPQPFGQSSQQLKEFSPGSQQPSPHCAVGQSTAHEQWVSGHRHCPSPQLHSVAQV
jgi:hypothetical protein